MLVTGFGPFLNHVENPSAILAPQLSGQSHVLEVNYSIVSTFAKQVSDEVILCLGLNSKLSEPAYELYAHNLIGSVPDSTGRKPRRQLIKRSGPMTLGQTLASPEQLLHLPMQTSFTPGSYLCNYLLYSLLIQNPSSKVGFVHVPLFETMPEADQLSRLTLLINFLGN
jgi:pyroglutamyl-peptidase